MHFSLISTSPPPHKAAKIWVNLCFSFVKCAQSVVADVKKGEVTKFSDRWGGVLESLQEIDNIMEMGKVDIEESDKELISQFLISLLNVWAVYVPLVSKKMEFSDTQLQMLQILLSLSRVFVKERNAIVEVMPLYAIALANSSKKHEVGQFMDDYVAEMNEIDLHLEESDWAWYLQSLDVRASTFLDVSVGLARGNRREDAKKMREQGQNYLKKAAQSGLDYLADPSRKGETAQQDHVEGLLLSVLHRLTLDHTGSTMSGLLGEGGGVSDRIQWGDEKKRSMEQLGDMWQKLQLHSKVDDNFISQIHLGKTTLSISSLMMYAQEAMVGHDSFEKNDEFEWYQKVKDNVEELEGKEMELILSCFDPQLLIVFSTILFMFNKKFDDLQVAKLGVDICTKGIHQLFCWPQEFAGLETLPREEQIEQLTQQFPVFRSKVWGEFMMNLPVPEGKKLLDPLALLIANEELRKEEKKEESFKCDVLELAAFCWDVEAREGGEGAGRAGEGEANEEERIQIDEMRLGLLHRLAGRKGLQGKWQEAASYSGYAYQIGRSLDESQMRLTHVTVPTFLTYALSLSHLNMTGIDKSVITDALETGQKFEETIHQAKGHVENDEKVTQVLSEVQVRMKLLKHSLEQLEAKEKEQQS
uniref:Uncharacterized protein n=1 Tax=Paramoeba aestuarina TaxID=180227 RepID=A0A7S4JPN6_9EUKA|mmetsp:Transcript_12199/g.18617  ORF Transcript_12199/g.18617 Transcript_12199/m.18617 type:complete len:643 (+) Transcript_12199:258-2186(+)